jgi:purine-cytosine permease-like protein
VPCGPFSPRLSLAIAKPGYSHFETVLENLMNIIAYWLAIYTVISVADHFAFKCGFGGYYFLVLWYCRHGYGYESELVGRPYC